MDNYFQQLKEVLGGLLPQGGNYNPVVPTEKQVQKIAALDENINNESFYFIFNCQTCAFDSVKGVAKWLGYSEQAFTVDTYLNAIHPSQCVLFNMIAHCMYKLLCGGKFKLQFDTQRYISLIALRHYNGDYIVFKKTTSVFQYDTQNRLLEQLNEFTLIESYKGGALSPRIYEVASFQKEDFEKMVYNMALESFMQKKYFSKKQFQLLQHYAGGKPLTNLQLAGLLDIEVNTIKTYNKRILENARGVFTCNFDTARDVALYLKKEKILG